MDRSEYIKRGEELLRKMAGDAYMKSREQRTQLLPDMNDLILGTVYGDIWNRPGLAFKESVHGSLSINNAGDKAEFGIAS